MRKLTVFLLILLTACIQTGQQQPPAQVPLPPTTPQISRTPSAASSGDTFQVYFTDPYAASAATHRGGVEEELIRAIDSAQNTIDIAMLNMNLDRVGDALVHAFDRGVQVRLVMDSAALDGNLPHRLEAEGISIIGDRRESLMHNKFLVFDGSEVWTGSLNLTTSGVYQDHNNMLRIRSSRVAEDYTVEFNEMFVEDLFGDNTRAATPNPRLTLDGRRVEVYFSPDDGVLQHLLQLVQSAHSSIQFMAFSFTSDALANAMLERAQAGVQVQGVFDSEQVDSNQGGEYERLRQAGLDVRRDSLPGQMHHKVILVDGQTVETGSYNFSSSAEKRNDENIVIVYDSHLNTLYQTEFDTIFNRAR